MARVQVDRRAILAAARRAAREEIQPGMRQALNRSRALTPVDTGRLRSATRSVVRNTLLGVTGELINDVEYAAMVHDGTRPHRIDPRRSGGVLRFNIGGRVVYARYVNHPGTDPRPFMSQAMRETAQARGWPVRGDFNLR